MIDMGLYRRFYRQKRRSFAGAGDGAICGGATFSNASSTNRYFIARTSLATIHSQPFLASPGVAKGWLILVRSSEKSSVRRGAVAEPGTVQAGNDPPSGHPHRASL